MIFMIILLFMRGQVCVASTEDRVAENISHCSVVCKKGPVIVTIHVTDLT